jgi:7-cyano-7-deazaguanine reductase
MATQPSKDLETFKNPAPDRDYEIAFDVPEFTCLCPMTGQPDFAHFDIRYVPDQLCVELKSLKLYMWSYRNEGAFHEAVTNRIRDDLAAALKPRKLVVTGDFNVRGGIRTVVKVEYAAPGR